MDLLRLNIVTPQGSVFSGDVRSVTLPGREGEFGVLAGHTELLSLLKAGVIEFHTEQGRTELVAINWGQVKVSASLVDILADGAVAIGGVNESEVASAIGRARALLEEATDNRLAISAVVARIETVVKDSL